MFSSFYRTSTLLHARLFFVKVFANSRDWIQTTFSFQGQNGRRHWALGSISVLYSNITFDFHLFFVFFPFILLSLKYRKCSTFGSWEWTNNRDVWCGRRQRVASFRGQTDNFHWIGMPRALFSCIPCIVYHYSGYKIGTNVSVVPFKEVQICRRMFRQQKSLYGSNVF